MWPFHRYSSPTPSNITPDNSSRNRAAPVPDQTNHLHNHKNQTPVTWPFTLRDERVMNALSKIPRDRFIPETEKIHAWENRALPIGLGQTISQPYIVALMTQLLEIKPNSRILEVGTGSGYQSAVLAELSNHIYTVEVIPELSHTARKTLKSLGYNQINYRIADGSLGWPEEAPFDGIIVTCVTESVPPALWEQLKYPGSRLVIPIGTAPKNQQLLLYKKETPLHSPTSTHGSQPPPPSNEPTDSPPTAEVICPVRFVPMTHGDH